MQPIIKITNLSKQYRLGTVGTGTISNDIKRWWYNVRGKEDPFLKVGETNIRNSKGESDYVWALKDISFDVMSGEVLGIIGKNGAGKSTLLKILSKVTGPTTGTIDFNGRIGSLLEVGTGFHPELTGRENIFLNGAILGMTKAEIRSKLDEIVDFSGCERYIDTPVKRYSSGMTVRLGFAVAAHLEPEILVVDEVLAVGDAEFQKKAIGKIQDISKGHGRTVLFVSHNMASIKQLCSKTILLNNGSLELVGETETIIDRYLLVNYKEDLTGLEERVDRIGTGQAKFVDAKLIISEKVVNALQTGQSAVFELKIYSIKDMRDIDFVLSIYNGNSVLITSTNSKLTSNVSLNLTKGINEINCIFDSLPLQTGRYFINLSININESPCDLIERALYFDVVEGNIFGTGKINNSSKSLIIIPNRWEIN